MISFFKMVDRYVSLGQKKRDSRTQYAIVWWMGVDYELFCVTLCTRSVLLVIHSLGYTIPHTNPWVSAGVHTLEKKSCFSSLFGSHPPDYLKVCSGKPDCKDEITGSSSFLCSQVFLLTHPSSVQ